MHQLFAYLVIPPGALKGKFKGFLVWGGNIIFACLDSNMKPKLLCLSSSDIPVWSKVLLSSLTFPWRRYHHVVHLQV